MTKEDFFKEFDRIFDELNHVAELLFPAEISQEADSKK